MSAVTAPEFPRPGTAEHSALMATFARRRRRPYDWPSIRARFVEGVPADEGYSWPTLEQVADHFGVSLHRVKDVCAKERWVEQRAGWQAELHRQRRTKRAEQLVERAAAIDDLASQTAVIGLALCGRRLTELTAAATSGRASDARELGALAKAVEGFHRVGVAACGPQEPPASPTPAVSPIAEALRRDDPERLANVLSLLVEVGAYDDLPRTSVDLSPVAASHGAEHAQPPTESRHEHVPRS